MATAMPSFISVESLKSKSRQLVSDTSDTSEFRGTSFIVYDRVQYLIGRIGDHFYYEDTDGFSWTEMQLVE